MNRTPPLLRAIGPSAALDAERRQPMVGFQGQRFADFSANSYNSESRSVEAVLSSGSAVRRAFFTEELEISAQAVDLGRAAQGLVCLLDSHNQFELGAVLGTVSNVRIQAGKLIGTLTFGDTDRAREVENMVASGALRGVSIGYSAKAWAIQKTDDDGHETWRAMRWELLEVSLVSVPADAAAGVRALGGSSPGSPSEDDDMLTRNAPPAPADPNAPTPAPPAPVNVTRFSPTQAMDFINIARDFGLATRAEELVRENEAGRIGMEAAREAILRAAGERQRAEAAIRGGPVAFDQHTFDNPAFHARAIEEAIYSRMSGKPPSDAAREFRGMSMVALAAELIGRQGVRNVHRMTPSEILNAAAFNNGVRLHPDMSSRMGPGHTTSDFPDLLTASGNRHLLDQFTAAASVIKTVSRERTTADFREISGLQLSGFGTLPRALENGELKHGTFASRTERYRVTTFGKMFSITRQAIINDDLHAFAQAVTIMARAAAETEASLFAELINSNPAMADAKAAFHADHGNLAAGGAAPEVTTLSAGRLAMRSQKDLDGVTPLAAAPRYILASPKRETEIEQLLVATVSPTSAEDTNPFNGKLVPLIDPRLTADPWYLFADPDMVPVLEHAYLEGQNGPKIDMKEGWSVLGQEFRVFMDFGAGFVDPRGAYKNPGA